MATKVEQPSFDLLGKRWSALIVQDLIGGPRRFRELLGDLGRINDKVLSQRLKELEGRGIIQRKLFAEVPVRVEYTLTDKGRGLAGVINAMEQWDEDWSGDRPSSKNGRDNGHNGNGANGIDALASSPAVGSPATKVREALKVESGTGLEKDSKSFWKRLGL